MPALRIRKPFAASFAVLILASAYLGLTSSKIPQYGQSDKGLHFVAFFLITLSFYWILELPRRKVVHLTFLTCTAGLCIGSEIIQALLPNGRDFDPYDILANVVGSTLALLLSSWYHKRMLERKRKNKHYDIVPGEDGGDGGIGEGDVELGEGPGLRGQETGVVSVDGNGQASVSAAAKTNVTEELDNWDENADDDWGEDGGEDSKIAGDQEPAAKRTD